MNTNIFRDKNPLEIIFGFILTTDSKRAIETFQRINPMWCKSEFHKRVHSAIGKLIDQKKGIDLVSLMHEFKANGWVEKGVPLMIAQLTNDIGTLDVRIHLDSLFNWVATNESIIRATLFRNQFDHLIRNDEMTFEKFNEIVSGLQKIDFDFGPKQKTNTDIIMEIMTDHDMAMDGKMSGIGIGFRGMNEMVMLEPCDVMVVGARPAMGKTAFAISVICNLAQQGKRVVMFSLEMSKKQIIRRIVANLTGIDSNIIKFGHCTKEQTWSIARLTDSPIMKNIEIIDGTKSVNDMATQLTELQKHGTIDIFVIDYMQKIQPTKNRSRYESVTEVSNGVKLISQNMGIPCVALAQLSRDSSKLGKRPSLPDLKESGEIEQDASIVAFLHRPEYYGEDVTINGNSAIGICEFIVGKNREGEIGLLELNVDLKTSKFWS
jgi:replicative DNA helicase